MQKTGSPRQRRTGLITPAPTRAAPRRSALKSDFYCTIFGGSRQAERLCGCYFYTQKRRIRLWRKPRRRKRTSCPVAATACRCTLTPMRTEKSITNPLQRHQKSWRRPQPGCAVMDQRPLRKAVTQNSMQRLRSPGTGSGHVRPRSASQGHPPAAAETRALLPK